jgi:hypothetical protein
MRVPAGTAPERTARRRIRQNHQNQNQNHNQNQNQNQNQNPNQNQNQNQNPSQNPSRNLVGMCQPAKPSGPQRLCSRALKTSMPKMPTTLRNPLWATILVC